MDIVGVIDGVTDIVGVIDGVTDIVGVIDGVIDVVGVIDGETDIVGVIDGVIDIVGVLVGVADGSSGIHSSPSHKQPVAICNICHSIQSPGCTPNSAQISKTTGKSSGYI